MARDKNIQRVINQLESRYELDYSKYDVTAERNDLDLLHWLQQLQEELLDACVYIERIKSEVSKNEPKPIPRIPSRY